MLELGAKTFNEIGAAVGAMLNEYQSDLQTAYGNVEKDLSLSIGIKIEDTVDGNRVQISLSFVKEKIKDQVVRIVKEDQGELFGDEAI